MYAKGTEVGAARCVAAFVIALSGRKGEAEVAAIAHSMMPKVVESMAECTRGQKSEEEE